MGNILLNPTVSQAVASTPIRCSEDGWRRTLSSYNNSYSWDSAADLQKVQGVVKLGVGRATVDRRFTPWVVHHIERWSENDMIGYGRLFVMYARCGQPAHAATVASSFWRSIYRKGKSDIEPWPDVDAEAQVERIDDNDYTNLLREALSPARIDKFYYGGKPDSPFIWHTGDQDMGLSVLADLAQRGPTWGGVIFEDKHPALGGNGIFEEVDTHIRESGDFI